MRHDGIMSTGWGGPRKLGGQSYPKWGSDRVNAAAFLDWMPRQCCADNRSDPGRGDMSNADVVEGVTLGPAW